MIKASSSTQKHFHTLKLLRREIYTHKWQDTLSKNKTLHFWIFQEIKKFKCKKPEIDIKNGSAIQRNTNQIEIIPPTITAFKVLLLLFLQTSAF